VAFLASWSFVAGDTAVGGSPEACNCPARLLQSGEVVECRASVFVVVGVAFLKSSQGRLVVDTDE
jgi:hypothetical protein